MRHRVIRTDDSKLLTQDLLEESKTSEKYLLYCGIVTKMLIKIQSIWDGTSFARSWQEMFEFPHSKVHRKFGIMQLRIYSTPFFRNQKAETSGYYSILSS